MEYLYMMISENGPTDWEDTLLYNAEQDAIQASLRHPDYRVEIFARSNPSSPFTATYKYFKNGILQIGST